MTSDHLGAVAEALTHALAEATPPEEVKRRLLSRIGERGHYFLEASDGCWEPTHVRGLERRLLFVDPASGEARTLVRLAAETRIQDARELGAREVVVAQGRIRWGGAVLTEGDFHRVGAAAPAAALVAEEDSVVLVTAPRLVRAGIRGAEALGPVEAGGTGLGFEPGAAPGPRIPTRSRTVSASLVAWQPVAQGVHEKPLAVDRARGLRFAIVRMEGGPEVGPLPRVGVEELYVLEGHCLCADRELGPGDYHRAGAGTTDRVHSARSDCRMIVIGEP